MNLLPLISDVWQVTALVCSLCLAFVAVFVFVALIAKAAQWATFGKVKR